MTTATIYDPLTGTTATATGTREAVEAVCEHAKRNGGRIVNNVIRLTISGEPMGKPRMTQRDKWAKRDCVVRYRAWADVARLSAGKLPDPELIVRLDWTAYFSPPASWSKKKRAAALGTPHRSVPDRDNVDKAVLDALFKHDRAVSCGTIAKLWGEPARLEIEIEVSLTPASRATNG